MLLSDLKIKIYADGANLAQIEKLAADPRIKGFTTNPSVMKNAGVKDYAKFAKEALKIVAPRPISLEVFADDLNEMERQAGVINSWGDNAVVKIPVTNTRGVSTMPVVASLAKAEVRVNVTAVFTEEQVDEVLRTSPIITNISIFSGRLADTGFNPVFLVRRARQIIADGPTEIIWASPREVLNILHAESAGAHIITATPAILEKLNLWGKDRAEYSLETIRMFHSDAAQCGYVIG